jgi:hypothetical protein
MGILCVGLALANYGGCACPDARPAKLVALSGGPHLVPTQEARGFCERVPIVEAVRQVANIHLGPGLPELASIEGSLVLGINDVSISATE